MDLLVVTDPAWRGVVWFIGAVIVVMCAVAGLQELGLRIAARRDRRVRS